MKNRFRIMFTIAVVLIIFSACSKTDDSVDTSIEGRYVGTLINEGLKSANGVANESFDATVDVTKTREGVIEARCFNGEIDTTFMLNYYGNHDSIMVCLQGDAFEEMYGHMLGQGHMNGGMMGDMNDGETEWAHHLNDEHHAEDEHFGGFDTMNHTFGYRFSMMDGGASYMFSFQGSKSR